MVPGPSPFSTPLARKELAYSQGVVDSDDAAVQDGRGDGRDLEHLPVPGVRAPGRDVVATHAGHHVPDGLRLPAGQVRLGLENGSFGDDQTRGTVLYFRVDRNRFSYREKKTPSEASQKVLTVVEQSCYLLKPKRLQRKL